MTIPEVHELVNRVAGIVVQLQEATLTNQRIAIEMAETVRDAKETAEHARFTANSAAAGLTGLVVAHQNLERRVLALEGAMQP